MVVHAPKPQIRLFVHAASPSRAAKQNRQASCVEKSIIQIIRGPQLKTRRNRNFPHIQSLSHGHSALISPLRKVRSVCTWLTRRFGGSCHAGNPGIQLIVHALKSGIRLFDRLTVSSVNCGWYPNCYLFLNNIRKIAVLSEDYQHVVLNAL